MRSLTAALVAAFVILPAAPAWAADQAPVVVDDTVDIQNVPGIDFRIDALANDSDPDGDTLAYSAVTAASLGITSIQAGRLFYRPILGMSGPDTFDYTVSDGQGNTASGTVTVTLWADLPAPDGLDMSSADTGSATITWPAAANAVAYQVFRNTVLVGTTSNLTWTDTGLLADRQYGYRIASVNGGGFGGPESDAVVYRQPQKWTPVGLAVDVTDDPTALSLTWSSGEAGPWDVYRDGALVGSSPTRTFTDTGLVTGREYSYQVQTRGYSTATSVSPASALSAPATGTPVMFTDIGRFVRSNGASLGAVTVPERAIPGGRQQDHQNGLVLQQDGETPFSVTGSFRTAFTGAGGATGVLGFPLMQVDCALLRESGCGQLFERGSIWSSSSTPTTVVRQVMEDGWAATGWDEGPLGYPVGAQVVFSGGIRQPFEYGAVYWSAATGSHGVASPIYDRWAAAGYERGSLGYPTVDEVWSDKGIRQSFTGGTIWWSEARGAQVVSATLQPAWARSGWEDGPLGEPTGAEKALSGGRYQTFTGGSVYWSPATGAQAVRGAIRTAWGRSGWENGPLGYPLTDEIPLRNGGRYQKFQGGSIYWTQATGAWTVRGSIRTAWGRSGWENGPLGYPVSEEIPLPTGGRYQKFQGGSVYWAPATGAYAVRGAILAAWGQTRWESGRLGYPTSDETGTAVSRSQRFQGGTITVAVATGRVTITYR